MQRRIRVTLAVTAVSGALLAGAGVAYADDGGLGGLGGLLGGDNDSSNSRYDSNGEYGSNYNDYGRSNFSGSDSDSDYGSSDRGDSRGSSSYGSSSRGSSEGGPSYGSSSSSRGSDSSSSSNGY